MIFNILPSFSTLAFVASHVSAGTLPANWGTVGSPDTVGTPSNVTGPTMPTNGTLGGILFCQDVNWVNCTFTVQPLNRCIVMNDVWNDSISSIGPDNGTVIIAYNDTDCQGNGTSFVFPGSSDLISIGWNDAISSIKALNTLV